MGNKRSTGKLIAAIILCVVAIGGAVFGIMSMGVSSTRTPAETRSSVVWVYEYAEDSMGNNLMASGTGWAIGKPGEDVRYIVTNGHVVNEAYNYPKQDPSIYGEIRVYFSAAEADYVIPEVVYFSPADDKDIAILRLPSATDKREPMIIRPSADVQVGETAYALGYPGISQQRTSYKTYGMDDITVTQGVISKRMKPNGVNYESFQMDVQIAGGNSGGPLVDKDGYVIGINTLSAVEYITDDSKVDLGMNYAIIMDELIKVLDSEKYPYTLKGETNFMNWKTLTGCGVFLVGLIAAIALFATSKVKAPAAAPAAAGAGMGAAAGAAAGRPGPQAPPQGQGYVQQRAPQVPRAVIRGVTGRFAGQSFDLTRGKIVMGRMPGVCNIVFEEGTPGVSGNHCQVTYDPVSDSCMITDNGSSYGTFLANGKKLSPNVPERINFGDTFYLADGTNKFVVTKE